MTANLCAYAVHNSKSVDWPVPIIPYLKENIRGIMNEHDQGSNTDIVCTPGEAQQD